LDAGRKDEADAAFAEWFELAKAVGSKSEMAQVALYLGGEFERAGQPKRAEEAYAAAARGFANLGDEARGVIARLKKACIRHPDGQLVVDLLELASLKRDVARLDDPRLTVPYHATLALVHLDQQRWAAAAGELRTAIDAAERRYAAVDDPQLQASFGGG